MPDGNYRDNLKNNIENYISDGNSDNVIARRLFCFDRPVILSLDEYKDHGFELLNDVSEYFNIPLRRIYIAGTVQTGYSFFKNKEFVPKASDIDLAIVDTSLFKKYLETVIRETKLYKDNTKFEVNHYKQFKNYISKGIFNAEYMPNISLRNEWEKFFNDISTKYSEQFSTVNSFIYLSETTFEWKQVSILDEYRNNEE
jgi:hypothetical protein